MRAAVLSMCVRYGVLLAHNLGMTVARISEIAPPEMVISFVAGAFFR